LDFSASPIVAVDEDFEVDGRTILFNLFALDLFAAAVAQADAPRLRADLDDLEIVSCLVRAAPRTSAGRCGRKLDWPSSRAALLNLRIVAERSMFSPSSTTHERGDARTLPFNDLPDLVRLNQSPQMSFTCLMPSGHARFSGSIFNTLAVISSPS